MVKKYSFKLKVSVFAILALLILSNIAMAAKVTKKVLPVMNCKKEMSNWCGVASCQSVIRYVTGKAASQSELHKIARGDTKNTGLTPEQVGKVLKKYNIKFKTTGNLKFSDLCNQIRANKPLIVRIGGRIAVVNGFDEKGQKVIVMHPDDGKYREYVYSKFKSSYTFYEIKK